MMRTILLVPALALVAALSAALPGAAAGSEAPSPAEVSAIAANIRKLDARRGDSGYRVPSASMEPTLHCVKPGYGCGAAVADRILVRPYEHGAQPRRRDIVVFRAPPASKRVCGSGGVFIKRIIGLPGEIWSETAGYPMIDGRRLAEPYVQPERRDVRTIARTAIGRGRYYLLGDNRSSSCDSRHFGAVARSSIIGRVVGIYWPTQRLRRF
jgi:signal peptidase I